MTRRDCRDPIWMRTSCTAEDTRFHVGFKPYTTIKFGMNFDLLLLSSSSSSSSF